MYIQFWARLDTKILVSLRVTQPTFSYYLRKGVGPTYCCGLVLLLTQNMENIVLFSLRCNFLLMFVHFLTMQFVIDIRKNCKTLCKQCPLPQPHSCARIQDVSEITVEVEARGGSVGMNEKSRCSGGRQVHRGAAEVYLSFLRMIRGRHQHQLDQCQSSWEPITL